MLNISSASIFTVCSALGIGITSFMESTKQSANLLMNAYTLLCYSYVRLGPIVTASSTTTMCSSLCGSISHVNTEGFSPVDTSGCSVPTSSLGSGSLCHFTFQYSFARSCILTDLDQVRCCFDGWPLSQSFQCLQFCHFCVSECSWHDKCWFRYSPCRGFHIVPLLSLLTCSFSVAGPPSCGFSYCT
jgi:hypothetical protein